GAQQEAQGSR
ncbi:hypothetical protein BN1723_020947, partial [Verticillium longisporum]